MVGWREGQDLPLLSLACTAIILSVFIAMSIGYIARRANRRYARGREPAPSLPVFKNLSKLLFVSSMLLTLYSYWWQSPWLLSFHQNSLLQMAGVVGVVVGYIGLRKSFRALGGNYSPLFDAYRPVSLVTDGVYRYIRHPIYGFNLLVSFGVAVSSGSSVVAVNALVGLGFILKAIELEESHLLQCFPGYAAYQQRSWRLAPFLY